MLYGRRRKSNEESREDRHNLDFACPATHAGCVGMQQGWNIGARWGLDLANVG
jgi:hypothetical protein